MSYGKNCGTSLVLFEENTVELHQDDELFVSPAERLDPIMRLLLSSISIHFVHK